MKQIDSSRLPSILFKYRCFDSEGYHLQLLADQKLWLSALDKLNDPLEGTLQYDFSDKPKGIARDWLNSIIRKEYGDLSRTKMTRLRKEWYRTKLNNPDHIKWFREKSRKIDLDGFGICSFSHIGNDSKMWAQYSDNHKGFCVALDTAKLLKFRAALTKDHEFFELRQVDYSNKPPHINFFQDMLAGELEGTVKMLTTKECCWSHEEEFRIISWDGPGRPLVLPKEVIVGIVFGCKIENGGEELLRQTALESSLKVQFKRVVVDNDAMGLKFEDC